jgi:hypothetical protein
MEPALFLALLAILSCVALFIYSVVIVPHRMETFYRNQGLRGPRWSYMVGNALLLRSLPAKFAEPFIDMWRKLEGEYGKVRG